MAELPEYRYRGARAMVILHERHMRAFLATWREAEAAGLTLPEADDPDYASLDALLRHVLLCACGYLYWMCRQLELPQPEIRKPPEVETIAREAKSYLDHVLERWREPLAGVSEDQCYLPEYPTSWKTRYCIDAMLEHAVMHPIRHQFQLVELMGSSSS
jgi:hypothetical protein